MEMLFEIGSRPNLNVRGVNTKFPIHRIFCVGRNYADHAAEMGMSVDREAPIYFTKFVDSYAPTGGQYPYPLATQNYHYEMEFVVCLNKGGVNISTQDALAHVYGYACGLDMTRRDIQYKMRDKGYPWDVAKNVENSAIIGDITRKEKFGKLSDQKIRLLQNGIEKQAATLDKMIWSVEEIISDLSNYYHLRAGDVIFTGTPAGVGAVSCGDKLEGSVEGLSPVTLEILAT